MKNSIFRLMVAAVMMSMMSVTVTAQGDNRFRDDADYSQYIKYDRYLDVEVWTDDDEYFDGENISIQFRANKDCYVVVYNIDTRGHVNLLYPSDQWDDSKIEQDRIYRIPDSYDDYDLTVRGPEGIEYIQIVASRQPLPMPDWDNGFDLVVSGDPLDFMDYINSEYFGCDDDCLVALDMALFTVNEWEEAYFRPTHVYYHDDWSMCGSVYIDYPWGATIYIDGIYWGIAPLFVPRIYYGWHYITIYDHYGYCWEDRVNVFRRKSITIDNTIIKTRAGVKSKYREVQRQAYLDPAKNGYPDFATTKKVKQQAWDNYQTRKQSGSVGNSKTRRESWESTSSKLNNSDGNSSSKNRTFESHSQKSDRKSPALQPDRVKSAERLRSSDKASGKVNDAERSRKEKSSATKAGKSGEVKKVSPQKSSGSDSSDRNRSSSNSGKSGRSDNSGDRDRSSRGGR